MPLFKLTLPIQADSEAQALKMKQIMTEMYEEFGIEGIIKLHESSQSGMGRAFTNKFRKKNK